MDYSQAEKERAGLFAQFTGGQITREQYTAAVNALRVTDAQGRWWQPDPAGIGWLVWDGTSWIAASPPSGTSGLQPGTAKNFVEFKSQLMTVDEFKKMSKEVPLAKRPQKWWDLLSILGGCASAVLWLVYSGIREGFDFLTPVLMIGIPVFMIWFRADLDVALLPLQPHRKNVNKLLLVGIGMAFPFLTSFILFNLGIRNYELIQWNMIIGAFGAYAITRNPIISLPGMTAHPGSGKPPSLAQHGILVLLIAAIGSFLILPVRADDCARDVLNLRDCMRTEGPAEVISGAFSTGIATSVNGQEVVRTLSSGGSGGSGSAGGAQPPSPPGQPPTPPDSSSTSSTAQASSSVQTPPVQTDAPSLPVSPDDVQNVKEAVEDMRAEKLREMAEAAETARAAAEQAARDKLLQNLQRMDSGMVEGTFAHSFSADDYSRISDQIDKVSAQLRSGGKVDVDLYSKIYRVYEGRVSGRTIPAGEVPSEAQIFRETITGGLEGTSREIFTGKDADGNMSYRSLALRGLVGVASGGSSELAYTPASSVYTMKDYVDKGGDSVLGAFGTALTDVATGEVMGRGIGGVMNYGGKLIGMAAESLPPNISTPLKNGIEEIKDVLNTEIRNPFAAAPDLPPGIAGFRVPPKTDAEILDAIEHARATGEPSPGLSNVEFEPANLPPNLKGMNEYDQRVVRMVADKYGVDVHMRPTNAESQAWIESGQAHPKPELLKTKTINSEDVHLGFDQESQGLAACKKPKLSEQPPDMADEQWAKVKERFEQRTTEFNDEAAHLKEMETQGKIKWNRETGMITDARTGKPFAGDNDAFAYTDTGTGKPVSPFTVRQINKELQAHGTTVHNEHVDFNYSDLPDTPVTSGAQSDFGKVAQIDNRILNSHTATGGPKPVPLNTYSPKQGSWVTNWYKGPTQRSFVQVSEDSAGKTVFSLATGGQ